MKYFKQLMLVSATVLLLFLLSACGSSSSDSTESTTDSSISGVVVDGYLDGAKVFLDCNNNLEQDYNEVTVDWTDENGNFSLSLPDNVSPCAVVALGIANQTFEHYDNGTSEMLRDNLTMVSLDNDSYRVISPFTSLHWYYINNDNMTFEEARNKVMQELGLPSEGAVFEDFVARSRDNTSYRNMVQTSLKMGEYMGYYCSQDNSTDNMTVKMRNAFRYMHQNVGMDNFTENNTLPGRMDELFPVNIGDIQQ